MYLSKVLRKMNWCARDLRSLTSRCPRNTIEARLNIMPRIASTGMMNVPTTSDRASIESALLHFILQKKLLPRQVCKVILHFIFRDCGIGLWTVDCAHLMAIY